MVRWYCAASLTSFARSAELLNARGCGSHAACQVPPSPALTSNSTSSHIPVGRRAYTAAATSPIVGREVLNLVPFHTVNFFFTVGGIGGIGGDTPNDTCCCCRRRAVIELLRRYHLTSEGFYQLQ